MSKTWKKAKKSNSLDIVVSIFMEWFQFLSKNACLDVLPLVDHPTLCYSYESNHVLHPILCMYVYWFCFAQNVIHFQNIIFM